MQQAKKHAEHHQYYAEQDEERLHWTSLIDGLKVVGGAVLFFVLLWLTMAAAVIMEPSNLWR